MSKKSEENTTIVKDIHCPFCDSEKAVLINRVENKKISILKPAHGLKFFLSILYMSFVHMYIYGYKIIEARKEIDNLTYGFCPSCGNSYSMAPQKMIQDELKEEKFYKVRDGKVIMGICKGVSRYTGISLFWIRIMTFLYGLTIFGAIVYFIVGACLPFEDDDDGDITDKRFFRVRKGKDIMGICKGFSEYTGIPVGWVRLFALMFSLTIIFIIVYFVLAIFIQYREDYEKGIVRKKLYKVKEGKVFFGLCKGISVRTKMPLWLVRVLAVPLFGVYFIMSAAVPTEERD